MIVDAEQVNELVTCQSMLLSLTHRKVHDPVPAVAAIDLLVAQPHSLSLEQLAVCIGYVSTPEPLSEFLSVLVQHGYGSANAVLAFQVCYRTVPAPHLNGWLSVVGSRGERVSPTEVADWVLKAQQGGYIEAYRYLLSAVPMPDFSSLKQAQPIVVFGSAILRYLVEDKMLQSLAALRDWYFNKARGVHGLRWWGRDDDELFRLLLDDAYQRQNYAFVMHNRFCIDDVLSERIVKLCGPRPYRVDAADITKYDEAIKVQRPLALGQLMPVLPRVLQETGGILLRSVLCYAWDAAEVLQFRLDALRPMIDELLAGKGPAEEELGELAADAIALVYQTSSDVVRSSWLNALGPEVHVGRLVLESSYPMNWLHAVRRLKSELERISLLAMVQAKFHAEKFDSYHFDNIYYACRNMRSKRLTQDARDPWSLAAHLGVLLAAAGDDHEIQQWRSQGLEQVAQIAEEGAQAFEYMEQLDKLFSSSLPDALEKNSGSFLTRFLAGDAEFFAERLVGKAALAAVSAYSPEQKLKEAFSQVQQNVLSVCRRWVKREKAKFSIDKKGNKGASVTKLAAVLSKHPAAYFAKHAANLCSKDRHEMWHEPRHSHLVVFDHEQRQLAGMALVNIEIVPALHPERESLVIRAINPMDKMLATHTVESIVEAFLDVAVQIASTNNLAAVAIPWHNGMHLLSNLRPVEKYLEKQYIKKAEHSYGISGLVKHTTARKVDWRAKPQAFAGQFYAYQNGHELVSTLYAIWCEREVKIDEEEFEQVEQLA
uniref:hypothetical protein n=1 Tax=Rheinheimera sp. TaxID=1869214 RepID=UPI0040487530